MHMTEHRAHVSVEGPVFVFVVMCSWQWTQVNVTGPSESSVGTTSWVATGGGALYSGPWSEKEICKRCCTSGYIYSQNHHFSMFTLLTRLKGFSP